MKLKYICPTCGDTIESDNMRRVFCRKPLCQFFRRCGKVDRFCKNCGGLIPYQSHRTVFCCDACGYVGRMENQRERRKGVVA